MEQQIRHTRTLERERKTNVFAHLHFISTILIQSNAMWKSRSFIDMLLNAIYALPEIEKLIDMPNK